MLRKNTLLWKSRSTSIVGWSRHFIGTSSLKIFLLVAPLRKTKRRADLMKVYRGTRGRAMMIEDPQELPYSITCTSRPNIFLYTFSLSLCRRNQAVYMTTLILSEVIIANEGKKISFLLSWRSNQFSWYNTVDSRRILV